MPVRKFSLGLIEPRLNNNRFLVQILITDGKMMKRVLVLLGVMGLSSALYAGTVGNPMVVPTGTTLMANSTPGTWTLGIEALYLKLTAPNYQYAQVNSNLTPYNSVNNQSVSNTAQMAFAADATYHFVGTDRTVGLSYMHANFDDSNTTTLGAGQTFAEPFGMLPSRHDYVNSIKGETHNRYDAADLVLGQTLRVGNTVELHPFMGLRYVDLNSRENSTYYNDTSYSTSRQPVYPVEGTVQTTSYFQGMGPRAGFDTTVHLGSSFSIVGTMGGTLALGYDDFTTLTQVNGELPTKSSLPKDWYVVPELDARLGLDYQHGINQGNSFDIQLGYQVVNYFNALDLNNTDVNGSSLTDGQVNSTINKQDFGFSGPYLRLALNLA